MRRHPTKESFGNIPVSRAKRGRSGREEYFEAAPASLQFSLILCAAF